MEVACPYLVDLVLIVDADGDLFSPEVPREDEKPEVSEDLLSSDFGLAEVPVLVLAAESHLSDLLRLGLESGVIVDNLL